MATTRIMPLHTGKGRTESQAVSDIIDYVSNPQKTDNGRLVTGFACDSRVADAEFLLAKREYISTTGRVRGADDVLAYHVRQSFVPGEITPEEANRLGVEFAKRFTKGNHAFVVCTHIDKSHIHNHIIWNAVNLNCDRKFRNFWGSTRAVRRLNDTICVENGYSIVEDPKPHGKSYNKTLTLIVSGTKFTGRLFKAAIMKYLAHLKEQKMQKQREKGAEVKPQGRQTVKQLIGQNQGVSNLEITDPSIKAFERVARKYGVDYAVKKDRSCSPPKYLVFFKARDADALTSAFTEYTQKKVRKASRPSVLAKLNQFKELVKNAVVDRTKRKELER